MRREAVFLAQKVAHCGGVTLHVDVRGCAGGKPLQQECWRGAVPRRRSIVAQKSERRGPSLNGDDCCLSSPLTPTWFAPDCCDDDANADADVGEEVAPLAAPARTCMSRSSSASFVVNSCMIMFQALANAS
jgi:hypothetical protein